MFETSVNDQEKAQLVSYSYDADDVDNQLSILAAEHSMVLRKTRTIMGRIAFCGFCLSMTLQMRNSIFVLYARTMEGYTNDGDIGAVIYLNYVVSGLLCVIFGAVGDLWRFDYLLITAMMIDVCTFFIEATSTSFVVLSFGYIIGGQALQSIIYGYMCKVLPEYDSKELQTQFIVFYVVGYILGPITGGLIANYTTYRNVFYASAIIVTVFFVYILLFLRNSQTKLIDLQLEFKEKMIESGLFNSLVKNIGRDRLLPYCRNVQSDHKTIGNEADNYDGVDDDDESSNISTYGWFLICVFMIIHGLTFGAEASAVSWYTAYIEDTFSNGTVGTSAAQLSLCALFFIIITIVVLKYVQLMQAMRLIDLAEAQLELDDINDNDHNYNYNYNRNIRDGDDGSNNNNNNNNDDDNDDGNIFNILSLRNADKLIHGSNRYDICHFLVLNVIIGCLIGILVCAIAIPDTGNYLWIYLYWFYFAMIGICLGLQITSVDSILTDIMPKISSGKGFGTKLATIYFIKAFLPLIVGILWDSDQNWLFYIQGVAFGLILMLLLIIVSCEMCSKHRGRS